MKPRALVALVVSLGLFVVLVRAGHSEPASQVVGETIEGRLGRFYAVLAEGRFDEVWDFFGFAMRRDNRPDEYATGLKSMLRGITPVAPSEVKISTLGEKAVPVATATTQVNVMIKTGEVAPAVHTTYWVWEEPAPAVPANWFLAGDALESKKVSALPSKPMLGGNSFSDR